MKKLAKSRKHRLVKRTSFTVAILVATLMVLSSFVSATGGLDLSTKQSVNISQTHQSITPQTSKFPFAAAQTSQRANNHQTSDPVPMGVPILTEGFEGTWLPTGWTQIITDTGSGAGSYLPTWQQMNYDAHTGTYSAGVTWDYYHQDEWLITPQFTLAGSTTGNYYVTFWTYGYEGSTYLDHYYVKISTDGGTSWTTLFDMSALTGNAWNYYDYPYTISLNAYAGQNVKLAWQAVDGDGYGLWWYWLIDDVEVGYFDVPDNDVGVTSIDAPVTGTATGPITPKVTVKNFGAADQTNVPVDIELTRYGTPVSYFSSGFETYSAGYYNFNAGWTNTTINTAPYGGWYMYSSAATYSASTYPRIQEASSNSLAQDASLISPIIDCSALAAVRLSFTKYFYASATSDAVFTVYGSNDGGLTWGYTLCTYSATSSTTETLDITSWAAGQNDVRFRFRFESPADATLSSYCYFDNMWVGNPTGEWGPYGDVPPAGWTIERKDTTSWDYNHWHKYAYTSYDCYGSVARMYYASPYPEVYDNLTSPSIDCSALYPVILQFNGLFYSYTTYQNKGFVDVSTDGGTTWQNIDDYQLVSPGSYGYMYGYEWYNTYDITAIAAGHSDVKLRFQFTRPAPQTSGYWYLDNVRVHDGSGTFKFIETFDTGKCVYFTVFKNFIHDNWGSWDWTPVRAPYYNNKWQNLATGTSPTCSPHSGGLMAQYYSYLAYQGMENRMYSFPINVAAANVLKMSFWMFHDAVVGAAKIDVVASHDGHTWTTLATYNRNDGTTGWSQNFIDLAGYEDDTALQIGFVATADYVANIYIDDVNIFDPGLILEYSDTAYVDVDAGESVQVSFDPWTPIGWHDITYENTDSLYDAFAETNLATDIVPANDADSSSFTIHYPYMHDIQLLSIDSPTANGPGQTQHIKATIKNLGQYPERNFFVPFQIGSTTYATTVISSQDFEATNGGYTASGVAGWAWGVPTLTGGPTSAHSGTKLWGTGLVVNYIAGLTTLTTPSFTVPIGGKVNFWHWYDTEASYDGGNVKISIDGGATWTIVTPVGGYTGTGNTANPLSGQPIWTGHVQKFWEEEFIDISVYAGSTAKLKFDFGADPSVFYPGWYIDDVKILQVITTITSEYDESAAVASWVQPGQSVQLTYPDWTPLNLGIGTSGDIEYGMQVTAQNSPDGNTGNNQKTALLVLSYWHDVGIKSITSPGFSNRDINWVHYDGANADAVGLTSGGTFEAAARFTPTQVGAYAGYKLTTVMYCHGWIGGTAQPAHNAVLKIYDAGTSIAPGALLYSQAFTTAASNGYANLTLTTPVTVDGSKDIWVSIEWTHAASQYPSGCDAGPHVPDGDWIYLSGAWSSLYTASSGAIDSNWNIRAGLEAGGGPGGVSVYMQPGSDSISAIANNLGTFVQNDLISSAEIMDYTSDPNGTLAFTASVTDIDLVPFVGEEPLSFGTFNFANEGIYGVTISIPLGDDDKTSNNVKSVGVGVDDTPPVTTHAIAPGTPDGLNGWYKSDVTITLTATDPKVNGVSSGVAKIEYQVDGGSWQTYSAPFKVTTDNAAHVVKYKATDKVGNVEGEKTVPSFKIDKTVPIIAMNYTWEKVGSVYNIIVTATCSDPMSGMAKVEFYFNGELQETVTGAGPDFVWTYQYTPLTHVVIKGVASDNCGLTAEAELTDPTSHSNAQSSQQSHTTILVK